MIDVKTYYDYLIFSKKITRKWRYVFDEDSLQFIEEIKKQLRLHETEIPKSKYLYRAQIGNAWTNEHLSDDDLENTPCAYPVNRMKPLPDKAKEGRANPKGIPFLYLSTEENTAIAETRPWIGSYVSVGIFITQKDLKLVNFTEEKRHLLNLFGKISVEEYDKIVWSNINYAFSKPIMNSDETAEYIPTQYIAEVIRKEKYDGIVYESSVGKGFNIVLFNLEDANLYQCFLSEVDSLKISSKTIIFPYTVE